MNKNEVVVGKKKESYIGFKKSRDWKKIKYSKTKILFA
jgi:hypothetical protein